MPLRMSLLGLLVAMIGAAHVTPAAAATPRGKYLGSYRITYYWVAVEDERFVGQPKTELLFDVAGCEIARVSRGFRRSLDLEGTGRLADGRVLNVAKRTASGWRYVDLGPAHWGLGVADIPLVPLRSVAADPRRIRRGARLFLPAFETLSLATSVGAPGLAPVASPHGGTFVVDDVGSAIKERRLDLFIGDRALLARLEARVPSHSRTAVYLAVPVAAATPTDLLRR